MIAHFERRCGTWRRAAGAHVGADVCADRAAVTRLRHVAIPRESAASFARAEGRGHAIAFDFASLKAVLPVSFYGGYFGAGVGILMLSVFSLATSGDYRAANVAKNFVSSLNGLAATLVFATQGVVLWPQTLALAAGTIGGGLIGAYVARIIPRNVVRVLIVAVGATLTIAFARRYWI
ncbi:MAG: sulfite exporter TauE/SafE family protein [Pseudolabrys sp.]